LWKKLIFKKNSRFQFAYRDNASSLHKTVGELLRTSEVFCNYDIYQEYPVNKINSTYVDGSHHFDWVIPKIGIIIECHGQQHYEAISFTSNVEEAISSFKDLKRRDKAKKEAALAAGYIYVEVPYHEDKKLTIEKLLFLIEKGRQLLLDWTEEYEVEMKAEENQQKVQEQARLTTIQTDRIKEEKARNKEKRQSYLSSEKHKKELSVAREFRKQRYRAMKDKRNPQT